MPGDQPDDEEAIRIDHPVVVRPGDIDRFFRHGGADDPPREVPG